MLTRLIEATEDPARLQLLTAILVFWVIFCVKTIYTVAWRGGEVAAQTAVTGTTATGTGADPKAPAARRRRTPRA